MSGYNKTTGVFQLTGTKANYWFRRKDVPPSVIDGLSGLEKCVAVLRWQGLTVVLNANENFARVSATPEKIWEALSGQPSDEHHANHYYRE